MLIKTETGVAALDDKVKLCTASGPMDRIDLGLWHESIVGITIHL
jgi:hypothetical protein